jgi:molecular chaperone DnaJ
MNKDWVDKDFYKVLEVPKEASQDEIKRAYRKLAQQLHPDANPDNPSAEDRFKDVSEAYATLSNEEQRTGRVPGLRWSRPVRWWAAVPG